MWISCRLIIIVLSIDIILMLVLLSGIIICMRLIKTTRRYSKTNRRMILGVDMAASATARELLKIEKLRSRISGVALKLGIHF